jgi:hypothetical protein
MSVMHSLGIRFFLFGHSYWSEDHVSLNPLYLY